MMRSMPLLCFIFYPDLKCITYICCISYFTGVVSLVVSQVVSLNDSVFKTCYMYFTEGDANVMFLSKNSRNLEWGHFHLVSHDNELRNHILLINLAEIVLILLTVLFQWNKRKTRSIFQHSGEVYLVYIWPVSVWAVLYMRN